MYKDSDDSFYIGGQNGYLSVRTNAFSDKKKKRFLAASYRRHGQLPNKTYIFCYNDLETPSFCTRSHATPFHVHAPAQPEYPILRSGMPVATKSGTSFRKDRTASTCHNSPRETTASKSNLRMPTDIGMKRRAKSCISTVHHGGTKLMPPISYTFWEP